MSAVPQDTLEFVNRASQTMYWTMDAAVSSARLVICEDSTADDPGIIFEWSSAGGADGAIVISGGNLIITPTFVIADTTTDWQGKDFFLQVVYTSGSLTVRVLEGTILIS